MRTMVFPQFIAICTGLLSLAIIRPSESSHHRQLQQSSVATTTTTITTASIPSDVSVCNDFFFGRQYHANSNTLPFCVNGGYCKASWVYDPDQPCECLREYEGPHCEFEAGTMPDYCGLGCRNGGVCAIGSPDWQHYYRNTENSLSNWKNPLDLQHCVCPDGYYGILCERKGQQCGDGYCQNGGTCVKTVQPDGSHREHCDCTTATSTSTADGVSGYAGDYCESEATMTCSNENDLNGKQFCVNGGTCKSESHLGCNCQEGYVGPVCEFEDRGQPPPECKLTCTNQGICRKGAKDVSALEKYGLNRRLQESYSEDFEHCVCPRGYVGLQCEYRLDVCPGGTHACLNGGECVTVYDGNHVSYMCDCAKAQTTTTLYSGASCEMASTEFCTIDGGIPLQVSGTDTPSAQYCTNGGKCKRKVLYSERHPGCHCPNGFKGEHCQFVDYDEREPNVPLIVSTTVVAIGMVLAGSWLIIRRRRHHFSKVIDEYVDPSLPPTLDHIRAMASHGRGAEFTEAPLAIRSSNRSLTSVSVQDTEELCFMKKADWPYSKPGQTLHPVNLFNDVPLDEEEIREARKREWPNDARNDASNPITIFDEISIHSDDISVHSDACSIAEESVSTEHPGLV